MISGTKAEEKVEEKGPLNNHGAGCSHPHIHLYITNQRK